VVTHDDSADVELRTVTGPDHRQSMRFTVPPELADLEQADYWVLTYAVLIAVDAQLVKEAEVALPKMSLGGRAEVTRTDLPILRRQLQRDRTAIAIWKQRLADLKAEVQARLQ